MYLIVYNSKQFLVFLFGVVLWKYALIKENSAYIGTFITLELKDMMTIKFKRKLIKKILLILQS